MQHLWAHILAGEANNPGSFSRKTVNLVADLDKRDAQLFVNLCCFVWEINCEKLPLVVNQEHEVYKQCEIKLLRLQELGLITIGRASFALELGPLPKNVTASYYGRKLNLTLPNDTGNSMHVGEVRFTMSELELLPICGSTPAPGFFEYVYDRWVGQSFILPTEP